MQSAFTARHTESVEKWQLYTYNCWQECCAEIFDNIGLLSVSEKGATLAAWRSSRDLFPFTRALIPLKNTFTIQHKKTQTPMIAICPGISYTLHMFRAFSTLIKEKQSLSTSAWNTSVKVMNTRDNVSDVHKELPDKAAKLSFWQLLMAGLWTMDAYTDPWRTFSVHTKKPNSGPSGWDRTRLTAHYRPAP